MAFENLSTRLSNAFKKLSGKGRLTEKDVKDAMREVRLALLEADVNFKIVKSFISDITERAVGSDVLKSLSPSQQVVKIVNEELTKLMGEKNEKLNPSSKSPAVYMMVGLQGAGKTTATAKLSAWLRKSGKRPLMVACDVYRPAAIEQLKVLGRSLDMPVFELGDKEKPEIIAKKAIEHAKEHFNDVVLVDTAGRLHIDEELMEELQRIKTAISPDEIILVLDSMTGQDAVNAASHFNDNLDIGSVILSKLDGDTRGGAALSVRAVTGKPIKFASIGEKLSDLEPFHPDRMASRILGMGDVLSLIEKASEMVSDEEASATYKKLQDASFTLEDFLTNIQRLRKMGSLSDLLGMIPGMKKMNIDKEQVSDAPLIMNQAIIQSMTPKERQRPSILNASRRKRIAAGSGTRVQDVNRLIKQYEEMKKMMKQFTKKSKGRKKTKIDDMLKNMNLPF